MTPSSLTTLDCIKDERYLRLQLPEIKLKEDTISSLIYMILQNHEHLLKPLVSEGFTPSTQQITLYFCLKDEVVEEGEYLAEQKAKYAAKGIKNIVATALGLEVDSLKTTFFIYKRSIHIPSELTSAEEGRKAFLRTSISKLQKSYPHLVKAAIHKVAQNYSLSSDEVKAVLESPEDEISKVVSDYSLPSDEVETVLESQESEISEVVSDYSLPSDEAEAVLESPEDEISPRTQLRILEALDLELNPVFEAIPN